MNENKRLNKAKITIQECSCLPSGTRVQRLYNAFYFTNDVFFLHVSFNNLKNRLTFCMVTPSKVFLFIKHFRRYVPQFYDTCRNYL